MVWKIKGNGFESLSIIDTNGGFRTEELNPRELFEWKGVESLGRGIDFAKSGL